MGDGVDIRTSRIVATDSVVATVTLLLPLLLLLLLLLTAVELSLGGSSLYTITNKANENKYT